MFSQPLRRVRETRPIIHSITNYVTANDCANILLAAGASPIMSDDPAEAEDIASLASGLNFNLGTLNDSKLRAMLIAGKRANELRRPVVLDPVGAGSSCHRTEAARRLCRDIRFSVIRCNLSEIKALAGSSSRSGGVDAAASDRMPSDLDGVIELVRTYAARLGTVLTVTGSTDIVTDGERVLLIKNGHPMMSSVTGTGCQLSALTAAFAAASDDMLIAAAAAAAAMGVCGELAHKRLLPGEGSGTYRTRIIDAVYNLTPEILMEHAKYEIR